MSENRPTDKSGTAEYCQPDNAGEDDQPEVGQHLYSVIAIVDVILLHAFSLLLHF